MEIRDLIPGDMTTGVRKAATSSPSHRDGDWDQGGCSHLRAWGSAAAASSHSNGLLGLFGPQLVASIYPHRSL